MVVAPSVRSYGTGVAQTSCIQQTKSRLKGSCAVRAPTLEPATSKSNSKPNGCRATSRRHGEQATISREASQLQSQPTWALDFRQATSKGSKPTAVIANMGARFGELWDPIFYSKKGASQQQSWSTWALDFGKLPGLIF
jgi:hypothetical protein